MRVLALLLALALPAAAQLRPRRVGVSASGGQAGTDAVEDALSDLMKRTKGASQGAGDLGDMLNNPELAEMMRDPEALQNMMAKSMQAMMGGEMPEGYPAMLQNLEAMNPELMDMLKDPSKMQASRTHSPLRERISLSDGRRPAIVTIHVPQDPHMQQSKQCLLCRRRWRRWPS